MNAPNPPLSETSANIVENMAIRLSARRGGTLLPLHLLPHLPLSLGLIRSTLDTMVDGHAVTITEVDGFPGYAFTARPDDHDEEGLCVACRIDLGPSKTSPALCQSCWRQIADEIRKQADTCGWPAEAVYEHEILYLAAQRPGPHYAAELAGRSRYTLKRMKEKLKCLTLNHTISQTVDDERADLAYTIPEVDYPKEQFERNLALIQSFPAALREEVELRVIRVILTLAAMLAGVFALSFLRIPLPILLGLFAVSGTLASLHILLHRKEMPNQP